MLICQLHVLACCVRQLPSGPWCWLTLGAAIVGKCFAMLFGFLTVFAAVQLWERMPMDGLDTDFVDEDAVSDCR